jgi:hypothetical protein
MPLGSVEPEQGIIERGVEAEVALSRMASGRAGSISDGSCCRKSNFGKALRVKTGASRQIGSLRVTRVTPHLPGMSAFALDSPLPGSRPICRSEAPSTRKSNTDRGFRFVLESGRLPDRTRLDPIGSIRPRVTIELHSARRSLRDRKIRSRPGSTKRWTSRNTTRLVARGPLSVPSRPNRIGVAGVIDQPRIPIGSDRVQSVIEPIQLSAASRKELMVYRD